MGRTPHIHARIRLYDGTHGDRKLHHSILFDESITEVVYQSAALNTRLGRDTLNSTDNVYMATDCLTSKPCRHGDDAALSCRLEPCGCLLQCDPRSDFIQQL